MIKQENNCFPDLIFQIEDLDSDETISAEEDDEEEGSGLAKKNWVGFL